MKATEQAQRDAIVNAFTPRDHFLPETVRMNRLTEAAPESREHLEALSCKRLGPEGRSLPEHFFW
eukprot:538430-Alexandrium_andersonii.AAC.1